MNLGRIGSSTLARWRREHDAWAKTPHVIELEKGWKHPRHLRLGRLSILDWGEGPRLDDGSGTIYGLDRGLDRLRIPTEADARAIEEADAAVNAAHEQAERVYLRAFKRGRRPTEDEVRASAAQVKAEVGE